MLRSLTLAFVVCILTVAVGCREARFPDAEIKPVKGFSLGSAKFAPFRERPTAQELYDATCKLYDSFDSLAATYEIRDQEVRGWTTSKGRLENVDQDVERYDIESRIVLPDKWLVRQNAFVTIDNKYSGIVYWPHRNEYVRLPARSRASCTLKRRFGLLPEQPIERMGLLRDTTINGSHVYVLEVRVAEKKSRYGRQPAGINRFYLGKSDLLPRKIELLQRRNEQEEKLGVPENGQIETYAGVRVNVALADGLFSTKPPKGAKESASLVPK